MTLHLPTLNMKRVVQEVYHCSYSLNDRHLSAVITVENGVFLKCEYRGTKPIYDADDWMFIYKVSSYIMGLLKVVQ